MISANLFCSSAQTVECAADRRESTPPVTFPKTISEGICHLTEFDFQLVKLRMYKSLQLRRKFKVSDSNTIARPGILIFRVVLQLKLYGLIDL
jgi:hypothetical protein